MAQPSKRTPENRQRILDLLAIGTTRKATYSAIRMSHETFAEWLREDEEFRLEVAAAQQLAITRNIAVIQKAAQPRDVKKTRTEFALPRDKDGKPNPKAKPVVVARTVEEYTEEGDWRAAAFYLERMDRENFGKAVDVTSGGEKLPPMTVLLGLDELPDDDLDKRIAEAEGRTPS